MFDFVARDKNGNAVDVDDDFTDLHRRYRQTGRAQAVFRTRDGVLMAEKAKAHVTYVGWSLPL